MGLRFGFLRPLVDRAPESRETGAGWIPVNPTVNIEATGRSGAQRFLFCFVWGFFFLFYSCVYLESV